MVVKKFILTTFNFTNIHTGTPGNPGPRGQNGAKGDTGNSGRPGPSGTDEWLT